MLKVPKEIPLKDEALFHLAMRHRSSTTDSTKESYERLEFFGDSILGFVVAEYFFEHHPDWDQGMMSKARSSVVQEITLSQAALSLGLDQYLEMSSGEELTGGRRRPSILEDAFEALIGAIYLDAGLEKVRWFILEQLHDSLVAVSSGNISPHDYKSKLQEKAQSIWRKTPVYQMTREIGLPHERRFRVEVLFDEEIMGEGTGRSKKEAEQAAARDALELIERAEHVSMKNQEGLF